MNTLPLLLARLARRLQPLALPAILLIAIASTLVQLTGCAAVAPTVQYRELHSSADMDGMADAFALQANAIVIEKPRATASELKVTSVRTSSDVKYGIRPVRTWRAYSVVNLAKIPNTDVVSSIGTSTTDYTVKAIGYIGGAVVKLAGLATLRAPDACEWPMTIAAVPQDADGRGGVELSPVPACVSIMLGPLPVDAAPRASIPVDSDTDNFYFAACRDAKVTFPAATTRAPAVVRVADARFVQFVRLPAKGSVAMHPECGVSVLSKDDAGDSAAAIFAALAAQGKAVKSVADKLDD